MEYIVKVKINDRYENIADITKDIIKPAKNQKDIKIFKSIEEIQKLVENSNLENVHIYNKNGRFDSVLWIKPQIINDKEYDHLINEDISQKEYKELIKKVGTRFHYIADTIAKAHGYTLDWFDYDNGSENQDGEFNIDNYRDEIGWVGSFKKDGSEIYNNFLYSDFFPTRWLKENFEVELKNEIEKEKKEREEKRLLEKTERENLQKKIAEMKEKIFAKLTEEEKQFVGILDENKIKANLKNLEKQENIKKYKKK